MAPTKTPSSGAAISSLSPRSQLHVVIAISILLGFVYSFRRRSKAGLLHAPISSPSSSLQNEKSKSLPIENTRAPASSTSTSRCYAQLPLPSPTLSLEDTGGQPEPDNIPNGTGRRLDHYSLDPDLSVPSQPQEWHQVKTTEHHSPTKYAPASASARASFPQLQKETVQDFRSSLPGSRQTCRRKILEFK